MCKNVGYIIKPEMEAKEIGKKICKKKERNG